MGLDYVYAAFSMLGPRIRYSSTGTGFYGGGRQPTYADLMVRQGHDEWVGATVSSEANFRFLKDWKRGISAWFLSSAISPPESHSRSGQYLKDKGAIVSTFYLSNVEMFFSRRDAGATSAAMWRRCRSTRPAHLSDRFAVDATARASG